MAFLKVEFRSAVLVIEGALFQGDAAGLQVEELVERAFAGSAWPGGSGLVGRSIGIDDQMQRGVHDLEITQQDARAEEIQAR